MIQDENKLIEIHGINDEIVEFSFEKNSFALSHSEFLQGVFGPGQFEELNELSPLYISGLDSI